MIQCCGSNYHFQLGGKSNNKNTEGNPIICPPINIDIDVSSILSYSIYNFHSVMLTKQNKLFGIGFNKLSEISRSLPNAVIDNFTEFTIKDNQGRYLIPISVVCGYSYTLYLVSNPDNPSRNQLAFSFATENQEYQDLTLPIILNTVNSNPVSLFGGMKNSAAIDDRGGIIFINSDSVQKSPLSSIEPKFLPENEKAVKICCMFSEVFALSSSGRVFKSSASDMSLSFSEVSDLKKKKIVDISGSHDSIFAICDDGKVFGFGSNLNGKLGLGKRTEYFSKFKKISPLKKFSIVAVYAGFDHSLFQTNDGRILSCGDNRYGQLLLENAEFEKGIFSPTETKISGALCCIAGCKLSLVFIGIRPPNMANRVIQ